MTKKILAILIPTLLLMACASEEGGGTEPKPNPAAVPVEFYVAVPRADEGTRVGDPGSDTGEGIDWDRLTVIVAYKQKTDDGSDTEPQKMVYWDTFTRSEFESTTNVVHPTSTLAPIFEGGIDTGIRTFTMPLPTGVVRVYGITYSSPAEESNESYKDHLLDIDTRLKNIAQDGADHNPDIVDWAIPNNYATTDGTIATLDVSKFLSVATGYGINSKPSAESPIDLSIVKSNDIEMRQYWSMTLHRLATKLDIQWDAKPAFDSGRNNYVDVYMEGFTYDGGATGSDIGAGSGRLFPYSELLYTGKTFTPLGGSTTIYNQTPISKRNGRVYHYIFPDGYVIADMTNASAPSPKINFILNTTITDVTGNSTQSTSRDYYYTFKKVLPIKPAAWYKINTKITGTDKPDPELIVNPQ